MQHNEKHLKHVILDIFSQKVASAAFADCNRMWTAVMMLGIVVEVDIKKHLFLTDRPDLPFFLLIACAMLLKN